MEELRITFIIRFIQTNLQLALNFIRFIQTNLQLALNFIPFTILLQKSYCINIFFFYFEFVKITFNIVLRETGICNGTFQLLDTVQ